MIRRVVAHSPDTDWPMLLPYIQSTLNSTVSRSTGVAPHELMLPTTPKPLVANSHPNLNKWELNATIKDSQVKDYANMVQQGLNTLK